MRIKLVDAEQNDGKMSAENVALAHRHLREVGAVILENAIPLALINEVKDAYFAEVQDGKKFRQPGQMPFFHHQIVANPFVLQVLEAAMGKKIAFALYWIHANQPAAEGRSEGPQTGHIHRDGGHPFPELPFALPVTGVYYVRVFQHLHERYPVAAEFKNQWPKEARKLLRTA